MLAVALLENVPHQGVAVALSLVRGIDADERQVPVRLLGMMTPHLLHDRRRFAKHGARDRALHDLSHGLLVRSGPWRKPERGTEIAFSVERAAAGEACARKRAGEARHDRDVLMWIRP